MSGVIIIGSGHAGCNTAINLRRSGYRDNIIIFSIENELQVNLTEMEEETTTAHLRERVHFQRVQLPL